MKPDSPRPQLICPKCGNSNIEPRTSFGGPAVYKNLECQDCHFRGGTSRVYNGEEDRVEREIVERFKKDAPDAAKMFVSSIIGKPL